MAVTAACGNAAAPGGAEAKAPGAAAGPAATGEASEGAAGAAAGGGTTTTTALPDGGELQGAKLGSATHKEIETKGEGGPKPGGPSSEPGRRREDIQTIILSRRDEARACYDKALKDHPGIEGDLTVKWVIDPQGNVQDAQIDTSKSSILEPSVSMCVVEMIKKIKFASSAKGFETRASYPFNFHPRNYNKVDGGAPPPK
ncbi:MAG: AgmX/PglI C-terminal domain-containing protein [Labilithrix sp.]|nr:AgmX/PglI C-terminal domain-containing protein [Labilithrix sp.]